ncbi:PP2C family serine/threonine-protein phosphatase [Caproiciproducens faecalis]|uniref:Uncharacterized protein n=1 Tax=Caproiciproducens faecalis TaxID=2820301 RepID=A0ABS7DLC1_9FIRM|nr:hypothetical protein [Caproiciproducens faecalis]MBW7572077.1 hypothetical protein [Caproiciproducens faecalis]
MKNIVKIDTYSACIPQFQEEFCKDRMKIIRNELGVTAILAGGENGGARANLLTSFAVRMMETMGGGGVSVAHIANMLVESQPSGRQAENGNNIGFTLILARFDGHIYVEQFGTPDVIFLRRGKPVTIKTAGRVLQGKTIRSTELTAKQADTVIAVGSGMLNAGADRNLKDGWSLRNIQTYMENAYHPGMSAEEPVRLLLAAGESLSFGRPKSDLSALAFRIEPSASLRRRGAPDVARQVVL